MEGVAGTWAVPYLTNKQKLHRLLDKKLRNTICMEEVQEFAKIIEKCISLTPKDRPTMTEIVADLERLQLNLGCCCNHNPGRR